MRNATRCLQAAGGSVAADKDGAAAVEVSPLLSYAGEGLQGRCEGRTFDARVVLEPQ